MQTESNSPNQESRLIELEFQNERLKKQLASSIEPEKLQQIKDRLEDVERSKKSYEVSNKDIRLLCFVLGNIYVNIFLQFVVAAVVFKIVAFNLLLLLFSCCCCSVFTVELLLLLLLFRCCCCY